MHTSSQIHAFDLSEEVAVISGGGTGLGFGMARCLAAAGARVILLGRREAVLQEAAEKLGSSAAYRVYDVTDLESASGLISSLTPEFGPITILINNAGNHVKKLAHETSFQEFNQIWNTHIMGAFALSKAVIPGMQALKHGSILFTASMASFFGIPRVMAYSAAKTAMLGMVRTMATELSKDGIRVNAIAPGWIESDMLLKTVETDPERKHKILSRTPMRHFGQAEDIGWAAVYLCAPAARFVTGICLPVDGGVSIGF